MTQRSTAAALSISGLVRRGWSAPRPDRCAPSLRCHTLVLVSALAIAGCGEVGSSSGSATAPQAARIRTADDPLPNVIFIMVDTLRADRLGSYGYARQLTPTMDAIASGGVLFERCIAPAPWTLPSIATLFTAYNPCVHQASSFQQISGMDAGTIGVMPILSDGFETFAEVLKSAGYDTGGICANKFIKPKYGMAQGFDEYDTSFTDNTVSGELVNAAALKWLAGRKDKGKPFYLYLHYMDVHGPYNADPKFMDPLMREVEQSPAKEVISDDVFRRINAYLRKPPPKSSDPTRWSRLNHFRDYWVARYDAGVAEMDHHLGQLVEQLTEMGVWDDALIVLAADHGEALGERHMWDHGYSQFQTDLHVPLILRWPGKLPAGQRVTKTAGLIGVMPTLLELLGLNVPAGAQGTSLLPHIAGDPSANTLVIAEAIKAGPKQFAVVRDEWKLILVPIPPKTLPTGEKQPQNPQMYLFDLDNDPHETVNVAGQDSSLVLSMADELRSYVNDCRHTPPPSPPETGTVGGEELEQLRAVGYTGEGEEEESETDDPKPMSQPAETGDAKPTSQPADPRP